MSASSARVTARQTPSSPLQLEQFERLVYSRQCTEAASALVRLLEALRVGHELAESQLSDEARLCIYSRLAAAITALIADPEFEVSQALFDRIALQHATLNAIFRASVFESSDHLLRQFTLRDPQAPTKLRFSGPQNIAKVLLSYSLDSELELDFEEVFKAWPRLALPFFFGMLAQIVVLSPAAHRRREKLLTLGPMLANMDAGDHMMAAMADAYMFSSYAAGTGKHDIKRSINRMARRLIESRIQLPRMSAGPRAIAKRPTILVAVEWFTSRHAMFRCYARSIQQLRERFRLAMIGYEENMDAGSKELFDEIVGLPDADLALADVIAHVQRIKPDVLLYPSVGMAAWCVALSTVRLAPIQIATVGHPATTHSEAIDYMLVDGAWPGDPACFSETGIVLRAGSTTFIAPSQTDFPEPQVRLVPSPLRIAVPAMACKLNAPFMEICQSLVRVSRPAELHFFPGKAGVTWFQLKREIQKWIPNAIVHPYSAYSEHLRNLAQCDVHLSPFPFGGTNSNFDSMRLAIPMVTLEGREVHSQTDAGMMRRVGLPDWLITRDPVDYERAALRLIQSDAERVAIARALQATDVLKLFTEVPHGGPKDEFLRAVNFIYENHERIRESGVRYWTVEQREQFIRENRMRPEAAK